MIGGLTGNRIVRRRDNCRSRDVTRGVLSPFVQITDAFGVAQLPAGAGGAPQGVILLGMDRASSFIETS